MFNNGSFNNLAFNQTSEDFEVSGQDSLNTTAQVNVETNVDLTSSDEITITITSTAGYGIPISGFDTNYVSLSESIQIHRETSGLDPPTITLIETADIKIITNDELLVTDKIYLPLGFNQQGFNQTQRKYFKESEKAIRDKNINLSDNLLVTIDRGTNYNADIFGSDLVAISLLESRMLDKTKGISENLQVTFTETANVQVTTSSEDTLSVVCGFVVPLGFNQQGFNQAQNIYIKPEKAIRDKNINLLDNLNIAGATTIEEKVEVFSIEDLNVSIDGHKSLNKPEDVGDNVTLTLSEEASIEVLYTSEDSLLVFEELEETALNNYMNLLDSLLITIDRGTNYNADIFGSDLVAISLLESRILDKIQEASENLQITFTETANVQVTTSSEDTLSVVYDFVAPLGFNQQKFNQTQDTYIKSGENSKIGQSIVDSLKLDINSDSILDTKIMSLDILEVRNLQTGKEILATLTAQNILETVLTEIRSLNKPEYVQDNINSSIYEDSSSVANFTLVDDLNVDIDSYTYTSSTLMFNHLGKFRRIKKGYVLVDGQ